MFVALVFTACKSGDIISYKYSSTTMMGKSEWTITEDSVIYTFNGRSEPKREARATKATEWSALNKAIENIKLEEIADLKAPTEMRATDAAPFGKVYISTKDSTFKSKAFDGYNSHETLQPLLDEIKKITGK